MTLVVMSSKERGRVGVLGDVDAGRMTPADAAAILQVRRRQVFRRLKAFRACGPPGLVSRRRGRPSHRRYPAAIRKAVLSIVRDRYQAKGRVERTNKTRQDRLVTELRLKGASTIAAAHRRRPAVMADSNARFAKAPHTDQNRPRPLAERDTLAEICAWREDRPVSNRLTLPYDTVRYDTVRFLLEPTEITRGLRRTRVTVADDPEGRLAIF